MWRLIKDTLRSTYRHQCADVAAAMAFDFVFAIFPGILVVTALLAFLQIPNDSFGTLMLDLGIVVPLPVLDIVEENVQHLGGSSELFFLGMIGVIWPASASMSTTMSGLNRAFGVMENRSFWFRRILSIVLVISLGMSLVLLFNLNAFGDQVERLLQEHWSFSSAMPSLAGFVHRSGGMAATLLVTCTIYRVGADTDLGWLEVLPGGVLFVILWSFITAGFGYYVSNFGYYNVIYGLLGGVIMLLLSAYLVAFILLLGGELNGNIYRLRRR